MGHAEEALSMLTLWDELGDDFPCEFGALWGEMNEHRTRDIARQGLKFPSHHARLAGMEPRRQPAVQVVK